VRQTIPEVTDQFSAPSGVGGGDDTGGGVHRHIPDRLVPFESLRRGQPFVGAGAQRDDIVGAVKCFDTGDRVVDSGSGRLDENDARRCSGLDRLGNVVGLAGRI
jgi:hypothetical protein